MSSRQACQLCQRPIPTCFCHWITPSLNTIELIILQHPLEVNNTKNTARLLHLSLKHNQLHIGETFPVGFLNTLLAADHKTNLLLYPATPEAQALGIKVPPLLPDLAQLKPAQLRLIIIDATWRKSRKMVYLNPELQHLPRWSLGQCPPSAYHIRKAHQQDQLSTLEASCYALQQLESGANDYQPLLNAFHGFVAQQQALNPNILTRQ